MTKSKFTVTVPKDVATRHRLRFHGYWLVASIILPIALYEVFFYESVFDLLKFDLPVDCVLAYDNQQPWWMIPPPFLAVGGVLLYCAIVWIFSDKNDESGIINLVKNSESGVMVNLKI